MARQISFRYKNRVVKSIQKLGLCDQVTLTEFESSQKNEWYRKIDLLVIPSYEGMCQAMLEAGLYGVPVVAANIGGVPDVIRHKHSGFLFPYQNTKKMAEAVLVLLKNPRTGKKLGLRLRETVIKKYLARKQTRLFEKLFKYLADGTNHTDET